ncbi:hypothetical protein Pst134EA_029093 [Puccinia striiformis f. sp. tritici]|uniref:hypothetical protein n=1 Tax=Puccinia striiformis f. sp. tritici TaxID=168172 RepID=UPI0020074DA3|nr:hypothetical protein Pst134EA_029093 [Puccinia striiformis f. sp. tritici]KAH9441149.1 hypothetical protein Pst134EB_029798 [Puccinia striiformis f. sp. tritici]KAH9447106.1 hypothetical protein Pst134EA_029093 [Puccinia striiformis f. sp. tritici]KAI9617170.1 hypothetical protein H4Q26_013034 [Puccinia striiformis f. sp. tritici PST-130]
MRFVPYRQALHDTNPNPLNHVSVEEGRPLPTNEAEKMLKILETGRNPNSFLGAKHHTANLPNIIVPIPLTLVLQHQQSHH